MSEVYGALGKQFMFEVALAHNRYRRCHDARPLSLDNNMCKDCNERALEILTDDKMENTRYPDRGENIWIHDVLEGKLMPKGDKPVTYWYNQRYESDLSLHPAGYSEDYLKYYQYDLTNMGCRENFNQLVWKSTKSLGVGVACVGSRIVVVCHYTPKGNIPGKEEENVTSEFKPLPPK